MILARVTREFAAGTRSGYIDANLADESSAAEFERCVKREKRCMSKDNSYENPEQKREEERTKQIQSAGWVAGLSAFFAVGALVSQPTWPVACGIAAISSMVAIACFFMLKR
jgi:hypothetical protein